MKFGSNHDSHTAGFCEKFQEDSSIKMTYGRTRFCDISEGLYILCSQLSWYPCQLTHINSSSLDKMAAISQAIFSGAFSWMKRFVFWLKFGLVPRVQLRTTQHWFRSWFAAYIWANTDLIHWRAYIYLYIRHRGMSWYNNWHKNSDGSFLHITDDFEIGKNVNRNHF